MKAEKTFSGGGKMVFALRSAATKLASDFQKGSLSVLDKAFRQDGSREAPNAGFDVVLLLARARSFARAAARLASMRALTSGVRV